MYAYDETILRSVEPEIGNEPIYFVGVGEHDFQFSFGNLKVQNALRVDFGLQGAEQTWEGGACAIPVWLLIGQVPSRLALDSSTVLRITLASGDWIRLHTEVGPYECQTFTWPSKDVAVFQTNDRSRRD
jgi:hypothetical protein